MIDKIFVCHHPPLTHRKDYLNNFFSYKNMNVEWVEKFSPEEIIEDYNDIVGTKDLKINPKVPGVQQNQYTLYKNAGRKVTIPELSLYLKHQYCFEQQIKNKYETIVILEDDIMLPDNFEEYLNVCYTEFNNYNPKLDWVMMGSCFGFTSPYTKENRLVHYGENQLTRCTHAMMFSLDATKKILKNLYPINWPIDFKLNEIIIKENLKVGWTEPSLQQASHLNLDKSFIQT
jgi:GR25 family glycosyltransferase involved in LPS biosynthesis